MSNFERVFLRLAVIALALFAVITYVWVGNVSERVAQNTTDLNRPVINAQLYAGVPSALVESWQKATGETGKPAVADNRWMTVRVANVGYSEVEDIEAQVDLAQEITDVYALSADGKQLTEGWRNPEVTDGGKGKNFVKVEFPEEVESGKSHLLFVAMKPQIGITAGSQVGWSMLADRYWTSLTVTGATVDDSSNKVTVVSYAPGGATTQTAAGSIAPTTTTTATDDGSSG